MNAGNWEIHVWKGGHPCWCEIYYCGNVIAKIRHQELRALEFCVAEARREARAELPENYKHEA